MSRRASLALASCLALVAAAACTDDRRLPPLSEGPERWARRFIPVSEEWIPEREIPRTAQSSPDMVIWELNAEPTLTEPTAAELAAADAFETRCRAAAERKGWYDFRVAIRDGYKLLHADQRHYYKEEYVFDDHILDCERPEFLMYYATPAGKILTGFMFFPKDFADRGPQIGGSSTLWHYHIWRRPFCMRKGLLMIGDPVDGKCLDGEPQLRSPEMLHLWLVQRPLGRFSTAMHLSRADLNAAISDRARE